MNLRLIDDSTANFIVTGGENYQSTVGIFSLAVKTDVGAIHDLKLQGISKITSDMDYQDLGPATADAKRQYNFLKNMDFPKSIGGRPVDMLIGIKNADLIPTHVATLRNGLQVFQSPFIDVFGSSLIFGGSHNSFNQSGHVASVVMFLNEIQNKFPDTQTLLPPIHDQSLGVSPIFPKGQCLHDKGSQGCVHLSGPLTKFTRMCEQEDMFDPIVNYRCPVCQQCNECIKSDKKRAISITEAREQAIIESSVEVDSNQRNIVVKLPFTSDPIPVLSAKFKGNSNYGQAKVIYNQQCKKSDPEKDGIRKAFSSLSDSGFIKKLSHLPDDIQHSVRDGQFQHYHPWRSVYKADSVSTPVRLVVDPSMTGLNALLAKGENLLLSTPDILMRNRMSKLLWSTDISKLYNRLHLHPDHYTYSLF